MIVVLIVAAITLLAFYVGYVVAHRRRRPSAKDVELIDIVVRLQRIERKQNALNKSLKVETDGWQ